MIKRLIPFALAFGLSACGSSNTTSTAPTTGTGLTTDTFTGTVAVGGSDFKTFTVAQTGEVDVTLTVAAVPMGLAMGLPGGSGCVPLTGASTTATAGSAAQLVGKVSPGSFCVLVSDVGNATASVAYTVTVVHP